MDLYNEPVPLFDHDLISYVEMGRQSGEYDDYDDDLD